MKARLILTITVLTFCVSGFGQEPRPNLYEVQEAYQQQSRSLDGQTEKVPGYKLFKRAEHYYESRTDRNGNIVNTNKLKWQAWEKYKRVAKTSDSDQRSYSGDWHFVGPAYHSDYLGIGRVNRIAFHPTDPDIIYAATAAGGLWRTLTHGTNWHPLTESIPVNNLSGVAIDYTDPDIIYILTGDGDGCCGSASVFYNLGKPSIGVLKSLDGGQTWTGTGLTFDEQDIVWPYDLRIHPDIPEILYASTDDGIWRTINSGDDWTLVLADKIYEIEFRVDNPDTVFAVGNSNFYRSYDLGETWPDTVPIPAFDGSVGRMSLAPCTSEPEVLYILASPGTSEDTSQYRGLFLSTNGGDSFQMVSDTPNIAQPQSQYDLTITCHASDVSQIMTGAVSLWRSTDDGATFGKTAGGAHPDIHQLINSPFNDNIYAATDGGLFYTDDFGDSWNFMSEWLRVTQYYKIAISQQDPDVVLGGAQDNGTHRNENADPIMDQVYSKDGMDCAIHPGNDDWMIVSAQDGEFARSLDGGDNFDSLLHDTSIPTAIPHWVTPIAWDGANANRIMLGYRPVYRTFDGINFAPIPDTIGGRYILHSGNTNPDRVYAGDRYTAADGTRTFHLWTSGDAGDTWQPIYLGNDFPDTSLVVTSLTTNPDDSEEVWITVGGWNASQKVFRSTDAGLSWSNMTGTLPNVPVNCIVYHDTDGSPDNAVYIGTDLGVFYRDDDLGDWIYYGNGLPVVEVSDIEVRYADDKLVVGTYGRGIWESDLHSGCINAYNLSNVQQLDGKSYFFQAGHHITSDTEINGFGTSVIYKAGNYILLQDGFRAANSAFFLGTLGPCTGGVVLLEGGAQEETQ